MAVDTALRPLYVGGRAVWESEGWVGVRNPATLELVGRVPSASTQLVHDAVSAAAEAFPAWAARTAGDRAKLLRRAAEVMWQEMDRLSEQLTREQGKPLHEARGELTMAAEYLEWFAEEARRAYGELVPAATPDKRLQVLRQPVGVVAALTPWNFPASMVTRKIAPALAAGCTVVLKPSSATPLTAVSLCEIFHKVGFPDGVVNLVVGPARPVTQVFMERREVRKISFTGSTEVGRELITAAAGQIKRLSLELGGHAPFLVFDDADLEQAARGVIASKFRNAGQTCICANRLYVQEGIADRFRELLAAEVAKLRVGDGLQPGVDVGPLIHRQALERVDEQVKDAVARGGRVLVGGCPADTGLPGAFYQPTLIDGVADDALLSREETFGPLIGIRTFRSEEEAIRLANDTPYGLAAYAYTRDIGRVTRVSEGIEFGIVGINDPVPTVVQAPFGGMKESGWGREGGWQGLDAYLETKFVSIRY